MKKRRVYSEEFKREAVAMCKVAGARKSGVARNLGISSNTLYQWHMKYDSTDVEPDGSISSNVDLKRLVRENKRLTLELEILKKAIGIFSQELPKGTDLS